MADDLFLFIYDERISILVIVTLYTLCPLVFCDFVDVFVSLLVTDSNRIT